MLDVVPWQSGEPVAAHKNRDVTGEDEAVPVNNRIDGNSSPKPICMSDYPAGQHAPATSPGHKKVAGINVSQFCDGGIHAGVQIVEIISGILIVNQVAELCSIASATSWIDIDYDVAPSSHQLLFQIETRTVIGERSPVNLQDQRI